MEGTVGEEKFLCCWSSFHAFNFLKMHRLDAAVEHLLAWPSTIGVSDSAMRTVILRYRGVASSTERTVVRATGRRTQRMPTAVTATPPATALPTSSTGRSGKYSHCSPSTSLLVSVKPFLEILPTSKVGL